MAKITSTVALLVVLLKHQREELTMRAVAKIAKKDYKNVYLGLKELQRAGVITVQDIGRANKVVLNRRAHPLLIAAEYERRAETVKNKSIAVMAEDFARMRSKLYVMVLFGSHAKGTSTTHSDIDLCFIIPEHSTLETEIRSIEKSLPLNLHVHVFSEREFTAMARSKEQTVVSEMLDNHVVLYNAEGYYALTHD